MSTFGWTEHSLTQSPWIVERDLFSRAERNRRLVADSLVYRYDPQASPDGLPGNGGDLSLCTFSIYERW